MDERGSPPKKTVKPGARRTRMPPTSRACCRTASSRGRVCSPHAHPAIQRKVHGQFRASGEQPHSPNPSTKYDLRQERSGMAPDRASSIGAARAQCPGPALDFPVVLGIVRRSVNQVRHIANCEDRRGPYFKAKSVEQGQKGRPFSARQAPIRVPALRSSNIDGSTKQRNSPG